MLSGARPANLAYAEGYPSEFSWEVIDIFVGKRSGDAAGFTPFHILRRDEGDVIGTIGYSEPLGPERPSVGYEIVEPLWGKGYATEALRRLLAYLLSLGGIEAVQADTFESHFASRRVMEKAGMTLFDKRVQEVDGIEATLVFYEILASS
jgi:RimJ/RimL family protein N-acetyltransferase